MKSAIALGSELRAIVIIYRDRGFSLDLSKKAGLEQAGCLFHNEYDRGLFVNFSQLCQRF